MTLVFDKYSWQVEYMSVMTGPDRWNREEYDIHGSLSLSSLHEPCHVICVCFFFELQSLALAPCSTMSPHTLFHSDWFCIFNKYSQFVHWARSMCRVMWSMYTVLFRSSWSHSMLHVHFCWSCSQTQSFFSPHMCVDSWNKIWPVLYAILVNCLVGLHQEIQNQLKIYLLPLTHPNLESLYKKKFK